MRNPGAGPRWLAGWLAGWLAEALHESAFRHWKSAAAAASVRHESYTRGDAEVPGAACPGDCKTEAIYCPARDEEYEAGDTSDLVLGCGGTVSFTQSFVYLGSLLHRDLSDHHDVDARIKKTSKAFGALRDHFFSTRDVSEQLKGKIYTGGVLAVLLYGFESWCLTAESISRLRNWHNKRIREMCRVTMCQSFVHQISSASLQKRTGVFSVEYYLACLRVGYPKGSCFRGYTSRG